MTPESKKVLVDALRMAVQKESRFGIREDCRAECDAVWDRVVSLLVEELCPKARQSKRT